MIKNGYGYVLQTPDGTPLRNLVHEKLKHPRHDILSKMKYPHDPHKTCALCYDEMLAGMLFQEPACACALCVIGVICFSVVLYTGCDCYASLRFRQRNGDLKTWKLFDASLFDALCKLKFGNFRIF